jgi:uncharacterized membrane protein YccC
MRIIGERVIDTVIGCGLAIGASHLFPYWEYRLMGNLVSEMLSATRQYLESAWWWGNAPRASVAGAGAFASQATAGAQPGAAAAASSGVIGADEREFRYRLARKNVHIAFANLAQAFRRMMLEPKAQQRYVPELNDLLVQSHVLAAHITAAAPLLRSMAQHEGDGSQALQRALSAVREHLARAQAGEPPPADYAEAIKQIKHELDTMVVEIERAGTQPAEFISEIKLLALQCKQMLAASLLIRKDAGAIHLPDEA